MINVTSFTVMNWIQQIFNQIGLFANDFEHPTESIPYSQADIFLQENYAVDQERNKEVAKHLQVK